jgi:cyanophycinase
LVIVGGALSRDNAAVYKTFIEALESEGLVIVIPAASGRPARAADDFIEGLARHGFPRERAQRYPLAVRDDTATEDVDESAWSENAWDGERLRSLEQAAGFWFTGGDQMRIIETMIDADKGESPLLSLVRRRLTAGAVVGGTSAGAAIMSKRMIAGGDSFRALLDPLAAEYSSIEDQDSGRLYLADGLGFLPDGVVDQHFDRKARLGRLVRALAESGQRFGFGVDEDTAMVVDLDAGSARTVGRGSITLIDAGKAEFRWGGDDLVRNLELSVAPPGVVYRIDGITIDKAPGQPTLGKEYFGYEPLHGGGMAFANPRLEQVLGYDLLDNSSTGMLRRFSMDPDGRVLIYEFSQTRHSAGFWNNAGAVNRYTVSRVRLEISQSSWREEGQQPE